MSTFVDLASRRWAHVELYNCRSFVRELAALLAADGEASVAEALDNVYRFVVLEREVHGNRLRGWACGFSVAWRLAVKITVLLQTAIYKKCIRFCVCEE